MTDATTADKIAALELIEKHGLSLWPCDSVPRKWYVSAANPKNAFDRINAEGITLTAAVRAWAEAAGVPWPSVNVVPMWALDGAIGMHAYSSRVEAEEAAHRNSCRVVACEVVIRTKTEAAS